MRQLAVPPLHRSYRLRPEIIRRVAIGRMSFLAALAHDATNARWRSRPTSITTPPLLTLGSHLRSNTSTARTCAGPKMPLLDSVFALCRTLNSLSFFGGFAGARVSRPKKAFLTRLRPISRLQQRSEQNRCCRARRWTLRPQLAQVTGASRREALMTAPGEGGDAIPKIQFW